VDGTVFFLFFFLLYLLTHVLKKPVSERPYHCFVFFVSDGFFDVLDGLEEGPDLGGFFFFSSSFIVCFCFDFFFFMDLCWSFFQQRCRCSSAIRRPWRGCAVF